MKKNTKKLQELIYNQREMVKWLKQVNTRADYWFCKRCIDEYEEEIEKERKRLGLK